MENNIYNLSEAQIEVMLEQYKLFHKQQLELYNLLMKINLGTVTREELLLPIGIIENIYNAMSQYTRFVGLSLTLVGVELPPKE